MADLELEERADPPEEAVKLADNEISAAAAKLFADYERTLRAYQAVDFDDLIALPVRLFDEHPEVRSDGRTSCVTRWWMNTRTPTAPSTGLLSQLAGYAGCSPRWATTTRPSTPGAAPTSKT